jgi:hypothetical protein
MSVALLRIWGAAAAYFSGPFQPRLDGAHRLRCHCRSQPLHDFAPDHGPPSADDDRSAADIDVRYVDTPEKGLVGVPFIDKYAEQAALGFLDEAVKSKNPFFISLNFVKVHQPNLLS